MNICDVLNTCFLNPLWEALRCSQYLSKIDVHIGIITMSASTCEFWMIKTAMLRNILDQMRVSNQILQSHLFNKIKGHSVLVPNLSYKIWVLSERMCPQIFSLRVLSSNTVSVAYFVLLIPSFFHKSQNMEHLSPSSPSRLFKVHCA